MLPLSQNDILELCETARPNIVLACSGSAGLHWPSNVKLRPTNSGLTGQKSRGGSVVKEQAQPSFHIGIRLDLDFARENVQPWKLLHDFMTCSLDLHAPLQIILSHCQWKRLARALRTRASEIYILVAIQIKQLSFGHLLHFNWGFIKLSLLCQLASLSVDFIVWSKMVKVSLFDSSSCLFILVCHFDSFCVRVCLYKFCFIYRL